jgi:integrase
VTVVRKGGAWVAQVYLGVAPDGRKKYTSRSASSKREARSLEADLLLQVDRGELRPTSQRTVNELIDKWLETANLSVTTRYGYERLIDRYIRRTLGPVRLRQLKPERVSLFYKRLRTGYEGQEPLSENTVRNVHAVLRKAFNVGLRWGWLPANPVLRLDPPRPRRPEVRPPSIEEIVRILELAHDKDLDLHAVFYLAAVTGARRGEICGLRWSDVDFDEAEIVIRRAVVEVGGQISIKDPKTHATRHVSLDPMTLGLLSDMRARADARVQACRGLLSPHAYVYSSAVDGSTPVRPNALSLRFRQIIRSAGLHGLRLHDLRHSAATRLVAAGTDVRTVAARLGHADASTTLRIYAHALRDADRTAAEYLGSLFSSTQD